MCLKIFWQFILIGNGERKGKKKKPNEEISPIVPSL